MGSMLCVVCCDVCCVLQERGGKLKKRKMKNKMLPIVHRTAHRTRRLIRSSPLQLTRGSSPSNCHPAPLQFHHLSFIPTSTPSLHFHQTNARCFSSFGVNEISKSDLKSLIDQSDGARYTLVDVRSADETKGEMPLLPTAHNIPLPEFMEAMELDEEQFEDCYSFKKPARDDRIVVYCRSGVRSAQAAIILKALGYEKYVHVDSML